MDIHSPQRWASFLHEAINLAREAELRGNLPIGAVILLDGEIIGRMNSIWQPRLDLTRHAEMDALREVQPDLWQKSGEMILLTTLEPCLMCAGAILLHRIGYLIFGSSDPIGGVSSALPSLPPYFQEQFSLIRWVGPAFAKDCDPLYSRVKELERLRGTSALFSAADGHARSSSDVRIQ